MAASSRRGRRRALAAATLAGLRAARTLGRRVPARAAARAAAASNAAPAGLVAAALLRKCCRGGTLPEADAADVLMERLATCDDPTTLAAFCRAAHASAAARSDYARALAALARCTAALAPVLERCEAGAADDDDWAAARAACAPPRRRRRACLKDGGRAGRRARGDRGAAGARVPHAVAAFTTARPRALPSSGSPTTSSSTTRPTTPGAFHAAHCVLACVEITKCVGAWRWR